jgi:ribonuclease HII
MNQFYQENKLEVGLDEAGRGCLLGPVCIGAVIMNDIRDLPPPHEIRDSKKCSPKVRSELRRYIEDNAIAFNVQMIHEERIDKVNILEATMEGMEKCLDNITSVINIDKILVDGTYFPIYMDKNTFEAISHICIPGGDDKYLNIAAASILAKEYHDEYIMNLCSANPDLNKYDLKNNKGYGTKSHMEALKEYGPSIYHRKSFKPCQGI